MTGSPAYARIKTCVLGIVAGIAPGRVVTFDAIGRHLNVAPRHVAYILAMLTEMEAETVAWHRVVAKGGAIGRRARRDEQFARLVREGVSVSPAGVVQDLARVVVENFEKGRDPKPLEVPSAHAAPVLQGRSRGMRQRP